MSKKKKKYLLSSEFFIKFFSLTNDSEVHLEAVKSSSLALSCFLPDHFQALWKWKAGLNYDLAKNQMDGLSHPIYQHLSPRNDLPYSFQVTLN